MKKASCRIPTTRMTSLSRSEESSACVRADQTLGQTFGKVLGLKQSLDFQMMLLPLVPPVGGGRRREGLEKECRSTTRSGRRLFNRRGLFGKNEFFLNFPVGFTRPPSTAPKQRLAFASVSAAFHLYPVLLLVWFSGEPNAFAALLI